MRCAIDRIDRLYPMKNRCNCITFFNSNSNRIFATRSSPVSLAGNDVHMVVTKSIRHISKQVGAVEGDHFHSGIHHTLRAVNIPIDVDKASRLFFAQTKSVCAVVSVNADSAPRVTKPMMGSPWNWSATAGKTNKKIFKTFNEPQIRYHVAADGEGSLRAAHRQHDSGRTRFAIRRATLRAD